MFLIDGNFGVCCMKTFFLSLLQGNAQTIFWASAIAGTLLFALRIVTTLVGGIFDGGGEFDDYLDDSAGDHHETPSFRIFSLHSISGFFMMFGWVGLACYTQFKLSYASSLGIAAVAGILIMLLTAVIFRSALLLESNGTTFTIKNTVGLVGTVYQQIPKDGQGKIHVVVNGITRELLAQSLDHQEIESFAIVRVVRALDYEVVAVVIDQPRKV